MTKFSRSVLALAATALLGGCSMIPTFMRPAAPVAAQWPATSTETASKAPAAAAVADVAWQDFFADASLHQLIQTALANNRDLRVAVLNIEQTSAQLGLKRADQWPTVNAAVTGSRTPNGSGGITNAYSAGLLVTAYELDFFGRVASLKEQALAQLLATTEGSHTAQISLISAVAQTWLGLLADEELLALSRETLSTREGSLKLVKLRFDYGASSELDLRQAQSLLESARATLAQQQRQRALDENALVLLLGQPLPADVRTRLPSERLTQVRLPELPAGLPSDLLTRRPDIRQAEQQLVAANANIGAARAAFFPRISLTAGAGTASSELSALFKDGSWGFTLAPQLLLPLFDAGRNQAQLASAKVAFDIAVAQYEKSIQSAFREVADALAGRDTLAQQLQAQQAQNEAETGRLRLTDLRYQNGAASQLDWFDAQRSLFASQQALVQVRLAYLQNQVALYKTLGGGADTH
ncbi:MAG: efflux transporter outer membrane subunit [Rhodoferax sp.]|nr:efflux transporter outer membrane subunit [Rhodoferax sp.]MDP3654374.1 efflux transporter outer membrane subunit [Rhodoferax sp.]